MRFLLASLLPTVLFCGCTGPVPAQPQTPVTSSASPAVRDDRWMDDYKTKSSPAPPAAPSPFWTPPDPPRIKLPDHPVSRVAAPASPQVTYDIDGMPSNCTICKLYSTKGCGPCWLGVAGIESRAAGGWTIDITGGKEWKADFKMIRLEAKTDEEMERLKAARKIVLFPTWVYYENGKETQRTQGYEPSALDRVLSRHPKSKASFDAKTVAPAASFHRVLVGDGIYQELDPTAPQPAYTGPPRTQWNDAAGGLHYYYPTLGLGDPPPASP